MKPKKRYRCRKTKLTTKAQGAAKAKGTATGLPYEELVQLYNSSHEVMRKEFEGYGLWRANESNLPDADIDVRDALVRAVVTFRTRRRNPEKRRKALFSWVCSKVESALRNLAAQYPVSDVYDAFIRSKQHFGNSPSLQELSRFIGKNPRHVLNALVAVARDLELAEPATEPQDNMDNWLVVRAILARMRPVDACLLILRDVCGYTENEIFCFLDRAREARDQAASFDELEAMLDVFVGAAVQNFSSPWDLALLKMCTHSALAVGLFRARERFLALLINDQKILARMRPGDACLLVLRYLCHYGELDILRFLDRVRQACAQSVSLDDMESLLDDFVGAKIQPLAAPWDPNLLKIKTRGALATHVKQARERIVALCFRQVRVA